jgi:hypothetical protein
MRSTNSRAQQKANVALWTLQALLALLFLFAGGMKLALPTADLTRQMALPGLFLRFIGIIEVTSALGLVLPGILRLRSELTLVACGGIMVVMTGAVGVTLAIGGGATALGPVAIGLLAVTVAYGRLRVPARDNVAVPQLAIRLAA